MRLILPLPGNETFARRLAEEGDWELGVLETRRFPDGETYIRILSDVKDKTVDLVCTLARPDDGFLRLIFVADAARALGAREVTLIAPYLSYMRQDRRFRPGEAVTSRSFARLVCPSSDDLRLFRRLRNGGSGSSGFEVMRPAAGAASVCAGLSGA